MILTYILGLLFSLIAIYLTYLIKELTKALINLTKVCINIMHELNKLNNK